MRPEPDRARVAGADADRGLYSYRFDIEQVEDHARVLANLRPLWDEVTASTLAFSGIRLRNALPRAVE